MKAEEKIWYVYIHISPSHKTYVGITHLKPEKRWGKKGNNYDKSTVFYKAIKKYGWDNFEHKILFHNCSENLAKILEKAYIAYYKKLNLSYNMTIGGDGHNFGKNCTTAEYRTESSKKFRQKHPEYDSEQYIKHKDKKKQTAKNYYWKNREKILEYKKNNSDTKEKARIRAAKWREQHPDYMKNYMKIYNNKLKELNE